VDIVLSLRQSPGKTRIHEAIMTLTPTLYKIVTESLWRDARQAGVFRGAAIDLKDGFIHLSTALQVRQTASLHFGGKRGLILVAVDAARLGEKLVFEPSRGGDLFPHLYADLPFSAVLWEKPLPLDSAGQHVFPDLQP
jgi:uncharacterized protein (DUF952 family)